MWPGLRSNEFTYHGLTEPWLLCLLYNNIDGLQYLAKMCVPCQVFQQQ